MIICVLVCTIDKGLNNISKLLLQPRPNIKYIISHQYTDEKYLTIPEILIRHDIQISQVPGKGLSRNRNNALQLADGDIALIADDDVTYLPDTFKIIETVFKNDLELDVACFKIKTPACEDDYKDYPLKSYQIKRNHLHYISSIEISFRINSLKEKGIRFDERFGLGSNYIPGGEESVFIYDCVNKGLKVMYYPQYTVEHEKHSTLAMVPNHDKKKLKISAARDAYKTPILAIPKAIGRTIKYLPTMLADKKNPLIHLYEGLSAVFYVWFKKE